MEDNVPELVEAIYSEPFTKGERRALRRILGRATVVVLALLVFLLALNAVAAALGHGLF